MLYYDGNKLLNLLDIDKQKPELYICTGNRTGGKTTFWTKYAINRFLQYGEKFCFLYRFQYELKNCAAKIFKDVQSHFFKNCIFSQQKFSEPHLQILTCNNAVCGYCIDINGADNIKKLSHLLSDVKLIIFDEFQAENGKYVDREIDKFLSIHTSIARGHGEQRRYCPVILISNTVSLLNPYFNALDISSRLTKSTKFMRGKGFVLEINYNESAAQQIKQSGIAKAFNGQNQMQYQTENVYLDNTAFVAKMYGPNKYIGSIKCNGKFFGIKLFFEDGIIYCSESFDASFPKKYAASLFDQDETTILLSLDTCLLSQLRYFFNKGRFRFQSLICKDAIIKSLTY